MIETITKIEIITRKTKFQELKEALNEIGVCGMTVTQVLGFGNQKGEIQYYRGVPMELKLLPKIKVEVVVCSVPVETVIETCEKVLRTGEIGDGKIFIHELKEVVKIRTGQRGKAALSDD